MSEKFYGLGNRSVFGSLIHNAMERTRRPIREAKAKKERLEARLTDYNQYEKEVSARKGQPRKFSDREIDPKQIQADRAEYKKMYGKTFLTGKNKEK